MRQDAKPEQAELSQLGEELEALRSDRDRWREQAESWRTETQRLFELSEKRLSRRARRRGSRFARRAWRALPVRVREHVRPIVFPTPAAPPAQPPRAPVPRRVRDHEQSLSLRAVSVVIPTRDAGPVFPRVLDSIKRQQGVDFELIVVDSGSTDGTPELASEAGAHVEGISPEEFGHGRTRNRGADLATGGSIVMLVQDAVLLGPAALHELVLELERNPDLAAVSARQIPRSDADLYGAFVVWAHYRALWPKDGTRQSTVFERRASVGLDHVCAAIRRSAWEELRFADVDFAEDVEFAARATQAGWSLGLSAAAAVAHSHTRDSLYYLRRNFADGLFVAPLVGGRLSRGADEAPESLLAAGHALLPRVEGALSLVVSEEPQPLPTQVRRVAEALTASAPQVPPTGELERLEAFLTARNGKASSSSLVAALQQELLIRLWWEPLEEFAAVNRAVDAAETSEFVAKVTAGMIGRAVGDAVRYRGSSSEAAELLEGL
jgi:GT2 family glycosyltransferase